MRKRTIAVTLALAGVVLLATPARANIGTYCGGWRSTEAGTYQNPCYIRSANWEIAGRGKGYVTDARAWDQLNVSVTLQTSADGTHWSNVTSRTCGFTDIPTEAPGALCTTAVRYIDAGMLYRTRTFLVLFAKSGDVVVTPATVGPITT
jgi:hypothetical protein